MKNILTSTIVSTVVMFLLYNYAPLQYFALEQERGLGATITTINGSDTISSSRSVINTNFSNLNSSKAEISDVSGTTTLSSLSSVGTITTGTWNATRISVPYGGTGWASIASGTIMYGKGSGAIGTTTAGSDGQVLTLAGGTPNWQSGGVNQALDYTWTGFHNFSYGLFATRASSTHATTTTLSVNGLNYIWPTTYSSSNATVLSNAGAGTLTWAPMGTLIRASTTNMTLTNNTSAIEIYRARIPANTLGTSSAIIAEINIKDLDLDYSGSGSSENSTLTISYGGSATTTITLTPVTDATFGTNLAGRLRISVIGNGATNAQRMDTHLWATRNALDVTDFSAVSNYGDDVGASPGKDSTAAHDLVVYWTAGSTNDNYSITTGQAVTYLLRQY